jgi:hypothetical protein
VFRDDAARPLEQREQYVKRTRAERGWLAVDQQLPLNRPYFDASEAVTSSSQATSARCTRRSGDRFNLL